MGATAARGAAPPSAPDARAIVQAAAAAIRREYVDEGAAGRLADLLLARHATGHYAAITSPRALAEALTEDLQAATGDLHMAVSYDPPKPGTDTPDAIAEDDLHPRTTGWGVQTVARLAGNVGLLRVTHFPSPPERVAARYAAAFELLSDTSALVLDLTVNHGGGEDTEAYLLSYLIDGEIELGRVHFRRGPDEVVKTYGQIQGKRYDASKPILVAISGNTFSAGEALSAHLRRYRKAVLVGRRTRGGAHLGDTFDLPAGFKIFVVTARSTNGDWEGIGVAPDLPVEPEFAVAAAHRLALERVAAAVKDEKTRQVLRNVGEHTIENLSSFSL